MSKSEVRRISAQTDRIITQEDIDLMKAVKEDSEAYQRLKDKARWESMTLYGILKEWGDPREWN